MELKFMIDPTSGGAIAMPDEADPWNVPGSADGNPEIASLSASIVEVRVLVALSVPSPEGMRIVDGATANLDQAGDWILRSILPVTVATDDKGIGYGGEVASQGLAFMSEAGVGMVVVFTLLVGANDRGRENDKLEGRVRLQ